MRRRSIQVAAALSMVLSCETGETGREGEGHGASGAADAPAEVAHGPGKQGGVVARAGGVLYVADEDRSVLRVLPLPVDGTQREIALPGRPAAVLALDDRVLVTIRDPGMLLVVRDDGSELSRIALPDDAWGIALTPDEATAIVTSAWTHKVSAIDLDAMELRWTLDVAREPRGVAVMPDGKRAYVTHLVGADVTRIDLDERRVSRVDLPAAPLSNPGGPDGAARADAASLGYAAVLSPDGARLFAPRQALGATGKLAWNGQPAVDILLTATEEPLAQPVSGHAPLSRLDVPLEKRDRELSGPGPIKQRPVFAQPRAAVYRKHTRTLLVASEGRDALVELDALSVAPIAHELRLYNLGVRWDAPFEDNVAGDTDCGAPSGIALSADEMVAFVFCRSTATLAVVDLEDGSFDTKTLADVSLAEEAALGRRLFYDAHDNVMSFAFGCAGCHPDGRDDGHVWHEVGGMIYRAFPERQPFSDVPIRGEARQTPMLAGRVADPGPYGWRGKDPTLEHRVIHGFAIHHWYPKWSLDGDPHRARALARFLREGLVPPPVERGEDALVRRGEAIFRDATTGCSSCHTPDRDYSDRQRARIDLRAANASFVGKEVALYRTPSLRFVAGTPPYLHDGSAPTLEALIDGNHDRMGITSQLDAGERAALLAFLRTL